MFVRTVRSLCNGHAVVAADYSSVHPGPVRTALGGLVSAKQRWGLSVEGWIFTTAVLASAAILTGLAVYPFLAVTTRVPTDLLAVEGWVQNHAVKAAKFEFESGGYRAVFTTGGPIEGAGLNDHVTAAGIGAGRLRAAGIPADKIQMFPSANGARDRTYSSAVALRDGLLEQGLKVQAINVLTQDVHARRTRLLFQQAFGEAVSIGIIAVPTTDYDPERWWRYSEGVRDVIGETIAYVYAKIFFHPSSSRAGDSPQHHAL